METLGAQIKELTSLSSNYILLKRFHMPVSGSSVPAVSVTTEASKLLQSLYTTMLGGIALQIWAIFVLTGIATASKSKRSTQSNATANVAIWNSRASPPRVIKSMVSFRKGVSLSAFIWLFIALIAWAGLLSLSTFVTPLLIVGYAAPVNPRAVYIPARTSDLNSFYLQTLALEVPSNLRAVGVLEAANPATGLSGNLSSENVIINGGQSSSTDQGLPIYQVKYAYNLTGTDFGLQHAPHLLHQVQGSCYTEYGWYVNTTLLDSFMTDLYFLYGNSSNSATASNLDGKSPLVTVYPNPPVPESSNSTFAFVVSSVARYSFTAGYDPWYLTATSNNTVAALTTRNEVLAARPPLSCWQQDLWSNGGQTVSIEDIHQLPGLSPAMVAIFQRFLSRPRIIELTQALGPWGLQSATTSQGYYFDAESASLQNDLQRLVLGSYIATKNTLSETTMFNSKQYPKISNLLINSTTNQRLLGAGDFVVYGTDYAALRLSFVIAIPIVLVVVFLIVSFITNTTLIPMPWSYVNALDAHVIYSVLDTSLQGGGEAESDRNPSTHLAQLYPVFDLRSGASGWQHRFRARPAQQTEQAVESKPTEPPTSQEKTQGIAEETADIEEVKDIV